MKTEKELKKEIKKLEKNKYLTLELIHLKERLKTLQERNAEVKQVIEELAKKAKGYMKLGENKLEDYFFGHGFDSCSKELLQKLGLEE